MLLRKLMSDVIQTLGVGHVEVCYADEIFRDDKIELTPDIIFTDWSPVLDGINLIKAIRTSKANLDRYIPVVVVSAFTDIDHVCEARDAGMTEYLAKPVSGESICRRICSLVEHPREFIDTMMYIGPDRRRREHGFGGGEKRAQPLMAGPSAQRVLEQAVH